MLNISDQYQFIKVVQNTELQLADAHSQGHIICTHPALKWLPDSETGTLRNFYKRHRKILTSCVS